MEKDHKTDHININQGRPGHIRTDQADQTRTDQNRGHVGSLIGVEQRRN